MPDFDVQQVREAVESRTRQMGYLISHRETDAALAVIVPAITAPIRSLHYAARRDVARTPICPDCHGKAGTYPCGCWQDSDILPVCGECGPQPSPYEADDYPCPTIRLCDALDAATSAVSVP